MTTDVLLVLFMLYTLAGMVVTVNHHADASESDAVWFIYTLYVIFLWPVVLVLRRP